MKRKARPVQEVEEPVGPPHVLIFLLSSLSLSPTPPFFLLSFLPPLSLFLFSFFLLFFFTQTIAGSLLDGFSHLSPEIPLSVCNCLIEH